VVRGPEFIRREERQRRGLRFERGLARIGDGIVVVEGRRLVGVDGPGRSARDLRGQRGARERMIEASGLAVEDVAVRGGTGMTADEIHEVVCRVGRIVRAREDRPHGILSAVAVQIADDEKVGIDASGRIAREPVDEGRGRCGPRRVAIALTVLGVGIAEEGAARALRLQVGDGEREPPARGELAERLREGRSIAPIVEARVDVAIEDRRASERRDRRGLVEDRDPDRVASDRSGVDEGEGATSRHGVRRSDEGDRRRRPVVLHLHQAGDVRIQATQGRDELVRLTRPLPPPSRRRGNRGRRSARTAPSSSRPSSRSSRSSSRR
jgi:hypothetical protein